MRLRIVAGRFGGRRIRAPAGRRTRPTPERVREAWFSALHGGVAGARVLDLFAGSGALGLEALSRGARRVTFVERSRRAAWVLQENVRALGVEDRSEIRVDDVFSFLGGVREGGRDDGEDEGDDGGGRAGEDAGTWDLALADPPYSGDDAVRLLERWGEDPFCSWLCIEHASDGAVGLDRVRGAAWRRRYGDTTLSFYRRDGESERRRDDESERGGEP